MIKPIFKHQLVLITGGSSGIGLATAKRMASLGADVVIVSRNETRLGSASEDIRAHCIAPDQLVLRYQADVSDYQAVSDLAARVIRDVRIPDILVNSAGVVRPGECVNLDPELYRWMMDINFHGTVNVIKAFLPSMMERKSGHIVNISSIAGFLGVYGYTAYGASKFAVKGFSDSLRLELQPYHINVSIVFPPDTETPQLEEERLYKPPLLVASEEGTSSISADAVARAIVKGIQRRQTIITPGFYSTLYFHLAALTGGGLIYRIMDWVMADARRKLKRNPGKYTQPHKQKPN
ncbi:short-chain dehydrogenase of various substrate specificities [Anaerolinea thermolimosa]|nr:short-chain dehydrogenase of various substrate specificities [Anaerolinea thermolimosa]